LKLFLRKDRKKKNNLEKQQLAKNRQNSSTSVDGRPVHAIGLSTDKGFFVVSKEVNCSSAMSHKL